MGNALLLLFVGAQLNGFASLSCDMDGMPQEVRRQFEEVQAEGVFEIGFEKSVFQADGTREQWWTVSRELNDLHRSLGGHPLRIVIRGQLSPKGKFGHMGSYERCLASPQIVNVVDPPSECGRILRKPGSRQSIYVYCPALIYMRDHDLHSLVVRILDSTSRRAGDTDIVFFKDESVLQRTRWPADRGKLIESWGEAFVGIYSTQRETLTVRSAIQDDWRELHLPTSRN